MTTRIHPAGRHTCEECGARFDRERRKAVPRFCRQECSIMGQRAGKIRQVQSSEMAEFYQKQQAKILDLAATGMRQTEIAKLVGATRARVSLVVNRAKGPRNRAPIALVNAITKAACGWNDVPVNDVKGGGHKPHMMRARHAICYVMKNRCHWSMPDIARYIGYYDHSSVATILKRCAARIASADRDFARLVRHLMDVPMPAPDLAFVRLAAVRERAA